MTATDDTRAKLAAYLAGCDERYSAEHRMLGAPYRGPGYHSRMADGVWAHATRESLDYALALLRAGEARPAERATEIVRKVLTLQDTDPTSHTYGIWPWLLEEPLTAMAPPDWNWADFCGARLVQMLAEHAALLPDRLVAEMRAGLGHAAWAIFRRNVRPGYTNIAIMGAGVALAAGELLDEPQLADYGRRRLRRVVEHTEFHGGLNEYNSPTYTIVAVHECERILQLVRDPAARADAEALRAIAWRTIAEHFHPGTNQWAGPHSRAYSLWIDAGIAAYLSAQTGVHVQPHPAARPGSGIDLVTPLPCPLGLANRFEALPEDTTIVRRRFIRREGADGGSDDASTWGTTWLTGDACLGSVNRDNLWTQRHVVLAYWQTGAAPVALRLRFLHDGRDFASAQARNAQDGPRVLSAIGLLTNTGDFHPSLDRPADGLFAAEDFRVRYELTGGDVAAATLGAGRFALSAGDHRAVVHALPGRFGPFDIAWELGEAEGQAHLDGVCYRGPRRTFDFAEFGDVAIVAGLEVLRSDEEPAASSPTAHEPGAGVLEATWSVADGLRVTAPLRAEEYARG